MKGSDLGGYLITLEGDDGAGKSIQGEMLITHLRNSRLDVVTFREPGTTKIGNQIRDVLHDTGNVEMMDRTETLLYQASRAQVAGEQLIPALKNRKIVVLDRFRDSSVAYQGFARGMGAGWVDSLNDFSTEGLTPDLTILFDIDAEVGMMRRRVGSELGEEWNRMDALEKEFHDDVVYAYRVLAENDIDNRWEIVDASRSIEVIHKDVMRITEGRLVKAGLLEGRIGNPERRG